MNKVCIKSVKPMANGCLINKIKVLFKKFKVNKNMYKISRNSLIKILILEINDKNLLFFS